jgi:hypothetical protein
VLTKSIQKEDRVKAIIINRANGDNAGMKGIKLVSHLAYRGARVEFHIECLGNEDDLGVNPKIFMASAKSFEYKSGIREVCNNLVISK